MSTHHFYNFLRCENKENHVYTETNKNNVTNRLKKIIK